MLRDHSGSSSRYSTPPLNSRTPSSGYPATPATPSEDKAMLRTSIRTARAQLDDVDGLAAPHSDIQIRLRQIIAENTVKEFLFILSTRFVQVYTSQVITDSSLSVL